LIFLVLSATVLAGAQAGPKVQYTVSMPQPASHYFEVALRVAHAGGAPLRLVLPVWTPGSYMVREYARHVQDFFAQGGGRALAWRKVNKNTWEIDARDAGPVEARYRVYANELGVRSSDLDDEHGYFNGATLLMYPEGRKNEPYELTVAPHGDWQVATGLDPVPGKANTFTAPDYDVLVDSPVEMGRFELLEFAVRGVPHRIALHGPARMDRARMVRDFERIVSKQVEMFGEIPYKRYLFILHAGISGGGGLEHLNSTSLQTARLSFRREKDWEAFLDLVSHEFFHLWNVKRIRPEALGPFDYTQENYTRALWISEGLSDYYSSLVLARAGLVTPKRYFRMLATLIQDYRRTPGRLVQSAEESSFDAWIKYYRRDENSVNSQISYYDKGALLGLMLDLEIRRRTAGQRSLDDVMRALNENYAKKDRGFPEAGFQKVAEQVAGGSLAPFFADYVAGVKELPLEETLRGAGLTLGAKDPPEDEADREDLDTVDTGLLTREEGGRLVASSVYIGGPAAAAGLNAGDEVLALDGLRVRAADFAERLRDFRPGDAVEFVVFRDNRLRSFRVVLAPPAALLSIKPVAQPTQFQRQLYRGWLQQEWLEQK
jgi:predicted metalloprotease with PDZ domain